MGVGDTVASVIMLTQFECARPPCWHSLSVPGAYAYIAHSVWVSPAPMLTQFVWSPAPHADTNLKLKQWNNLKYLLFQTKQLRWDMNSGNQLSRQPKYRQQLKFQAMKIVCFILPQNCDGHWWRKIRNFLWFWKMREFLVRAPTKFSLYQYFLTKTLKWRVIAKMKKN